MRSKELDQFSLARLAPLDVGLAIGFFLIALVRFDVFPEPYDSSKWLVLYGLTILTTTALLLRKEGVSFPQNKFLLVITLLVFAGSLAQTIYLDQSLINKSFLDRVALIGIFLALYNSSKNFIETFSWIMAWAPITIAFVILYQLLSLDDPKQFGIVSFFGNVNMAAQFFGAVAVFQLLKLSRSKWAEASLVLSGLVVYFSLCRSAMLGLICAFLFFIFREKIPWKKSLRVVFAVISLTLVLSNLFDPVSMGPNELNGTDNSSSYRLKLWQASFNMAKDSPLGVGPRQFTFSVMPYKVALGQFGTHEEVDQFAHNEWIRYLTEDGFLTFFLILVLAGVLTRKMFLIDGKSKKNFLLALAGFFFIESLLQFPFENAFSAFLIIFILAETLKSIKEERAQIKNWLLLPAISLTVYLSVIWGTAEFRVRMQNSNKLAMQNSCESIPSVWKGCLFYANALINDFEFSKAEGVLNKMLDRQPGHFPARRLLSQIYFKRNDWETGCQELKKYNTILDKNSPLLPFYSENCQSFKD